MEGQHGKGGLHQAVSWVTRKLECLAGKTIEAVILLTGKQGAAVIVFTDGSFTVVPPMAPEPWELGEALADGTDTS